MYVAESIHFVEHLRKGRKCTGGVKVDARQVLPRDDLGEVPAEGAVRSGKVVNMPERIHFVEYLRRKRKLTGGVKGALCA